MEDLAALIKMAASLEGSLDNHLSLLSEDKDCTQFVKMAKIYLEGSSAAPDSNHRIFPSLVPPGITVVWLLVHS